MKSNHAGDHSFPIVYGITRDKPNENPIRVPVDGRPPTIYDKGRIRTNNRKKFWDKFKEAHPKADDAVSVKLKCPDELPPGYFAALVKEMKTWDVASQTTLPDHENEPEPID